MAAPFSLAGVGLSLFIMLVACHSTQAAGELQMMGAYPAIKWGRMTETSSTFLLLMQLCQKPEGSSFCMCCLLRTFLSGIRTCHYNPAIRDSEQV